MLTDTLSPVKIAETLSVAVSPQIPLVEEAVFQSGVMPTQHRKHRIRELAYYKWQGAGCPERGDLDFWLQAEAEYEAAERLVMGF